MSDHVPDDDWLVQGLASPQEVAERYDAWATTYATDLGSWSYRAPADAAAAITSRAPEAASVLDVGCGTGLVGRALRSAGYRGRLEGLDISEQSLRLAQESGDYDAVLTADLQQPLPLPDARVDVAVCVGVMTYLPGTESVWRELARVVRPGGLVVVTQREDLWAPRGCQDVVDRLAADGAWTPLEVSGPVPYLPDADGALAALGCYWVVAEAG